MLKTVQNLVACTTLAMLCACGGGGGGGGGDSSAPSTPTNSKVFVSFTVSSPFSTGIASFINPNPAAGTLTIDRQITGSGTSGVAPGGLYIDANTDRLYVTDLYNINVFNNASTASGSIIPARSIRIASSTNPIRSIFVDTTRDILYAAEDGAIRVFNNASTISGTVTPNRSISINIAGQSFLNGSVSVDTTRNILYVGGQNPGTEVAVIDNASTANGTIIPLRYIDFTNTAGSVSQAWGVFADSINDRIYVTHSASPGIMVFNSASTANGTLTPNRTILLGASAKNIAVNTAANRLYALTNSTVYIVNGVSTASGSVAATAVVTPTGSSLMSIAVAP